jgi:hypothetical protein
MGMAVRSMETVKTAMETDGGGSGGTSPSQQGARTETSVPRNSSTVTVELRTILEILLTPLGFSVPRLYIGEGALSGGSQRLLTPGGRGQGLGHVPYVWGWPLASLRLSFGLREASGKNKTSGTCFVQLREYFLCSFSETQNSRKQEISTVASCQ